MTCNAKIYVLTDINLALSILSGFVVTDILDITLTLSKGSFSKSYTKSGGTITIVGTTITVLIANTDITDHGVYEVKVIVKDVTGKTRGITPCPESLTFYA